MQTLNFTYAAGTSGNQADITIGGAHDADAIFLQSSAQFSQTRYSVDDMQDIGYQLGQHFSDCASLSIQLDDDVLSGHASAVWVEWLAFGFALSHYHYQHKNSYLLETLQVELALCSDNSAWQQALTRGLAQATAQSVARELMNKPANVIYPETFVSAVKELALPGVKLSVLTEPQMQEMGFGGLTGVAQGSDREGQLLIMDYAPEHYTTTIALVGKGVTFDSGGISIKGAAQMGTMKFDMGGAASVTGALSAIAALKLPLRVIGLCGLVENMPSGKAMRPGDVVTMLDGQSVEIISTDAEGRMVLADVLTYAQQTYKPDYLLDIATLTGGAGVALGKGYAALMGNDDTFMQLGQQGGEQCGERLWPLPSAGWFDRALKSDYADLRHGSEDRHGSACVAASFLRHFVAPEQKWIHIDSAAMAHDMPHRAIYEKAATGYGVLLLTSLCQLLSDA